MRSAFIGSVEIDIGPGNTTVTTLLDPLNISRAQSITGQLVLTTCATDTADKLDVKFQEFRDSSQTYPDTRAYFSQVSGNQSASSTAPYADQFTVSAGVSLPSSSRNARPTGSAGGTELTAGTVRDGPFTGRLRNTRGLVASHQIVVTTSGDANNNCHWVGRVDLFSNTNDDE